MRPVAQSAWLAVLAVLAATGCNQGATGLPPMPWQAQGAPAPAADFQRQASQLSNHYNSVQAQLAQVTQREAVVKAERDALAKQLSESAQQLEQARAVSEQAKTELAEFRNGNRAMLTATGDPEAINRDLHTRLAQSEQQNRILQQELARTRSQLGDTVAQLEQARLAKSDADRRIEAIEASTRTRGGATITANNSLRETLPVVEIPGVFVRQDGDMVRIEMPSDKLFMPGTATLHQGAFPLLEQVSSAVQRTYPRQPLAVVGHTDSDPIYNGQFHSSHQLSAAQSTAVFDQLTQRYRMPANRLQIVGRGASRPVVSNGTPEGKARNRRVEIVVFAEAASE